MVKFRNTLRLLPLSLLLIAALLAAAVLPITSVRAQAGTGMLRFLHAVEGGSNLDILVNGELAAFALPAYGATRFLSVPAGDVEVTVLTNEGKSELIKQTFNVLPGQAQTVVFSGINAPLLSAFEDELGPIGAGKARITASNAIEGPEAVDILQTSGGQVILPLITSLGYGASYGSADLDAVAADIAVVPAGADLDATIATNTISLVAGTHNRFVFVGGNEPAVLVLTTAIASEDANDGLVRLVHGNAEAPAVDLYIDDTLIAPGVEFGDYTPHVAVPGQAVTLAIRPAGADRSSEPLLTQQLDFSAVKAQTVVIGGTLAAPTVLASSDNTSPLGATTARIHFINATGAGVATFDIGPTTITSNDPAAAAGIEIPAVNTFVNVQVDDPAIAAAGPATFDGGVLYDVVVMGTADNPQIIFAATGLNETLGSAPTNPIGPTVDTEPAEETPVAVLPTVTPTTAEVEAATAAPVEPEGTIDPQSQIATAVAATIAAMATTPAPETVVIPVTATPVPETVEVQIVTPTPGAVTQPGGPLAGVIGEVNTDPGVNLKLREYPREDAKTLALMPSGSVVRVLGVRGPVDAQTPESTEEAEPTPTPTLDLAEVQLDQIWVFVSWAQADGGEITGWTKAFFLRISENGQAISSVAGLLALPAVSEDTFGEVNTNLSTPIALDVNNIIGTVVVDPGARLQVRRNPSAEAESLTLLGAGEQVIVRQKTVVENTDETQPDTVWLFISYSTPNGSVLGWVISTFITMTYRGRPLDIADVPTAPEDAIPVGVLQGDLAPVPPTPRPGLIATIDKIDPGANLQLRRDPSSQAESLGLIPSGTQLAVLGRNGDGNWLFVEFNGAQGWISSFFVTVTNNGRLYNIAEITKVTEDEDVVLTFTPGPSPTPTIEPTAG